MPPPQPVETMLGFQLAHQVPQGERNTAIQITE